MPPRSSSSPHHASSPSLVPPAVRHAHCRREHEGRSLVSGDTYGHSCPFFHRRIGSSMRTLRANTLVRSVNFLLRLCSCIPSFCSGVRVFEAYPYLCFPSPLIRDKNSARAGLLSLEYTHACEWVRRVSGKPRARRYGHWYVVRSMNSNELSLCLGCSRGRDTDVNLLALMVTRRRRYAPASSSHTTLCALP